MIDEKKLDKYFHALKSYALQLEASGSRYSAKLMFEIADYLKSLNEQPQADKWIPCEERLPSEENKDYLICTKNERIMTCLWTKRGWNTFIDGEGKYHAGAEMKNVIAWQPLPAPYKKEGAE